MKRISYKLPVCFSILLFFQSEYPHGAFVFHWVWCLCVNFGWLERTRPASLVASGYKELPCVSFTVSFFRRELVGWPINWHDDLFSSARNSPNEYLFIWTGVCQDHTNNARMLPWKDTVKGCKVGFTTWKGPAKCCVDWMGFCGIFPPILFSLMILVQPKRTVLKSAEAVQT